MTQLRGDIAPGRVQVRIENGSDATVSFGTLSLSSAVFATASPTRDDQVTLGAGRAVNLPVMLPALVCTTDAAPIRVSGSFDTGSGPVAFDAEATDTLDALDRLGARQCDIDAIAGVADIHAVGLTPRSDGTADLQVAVDPTGTGDGTLRIVGLSGTTLMRFAAGETAPLGVDVAAGDVASVLTVAVEPRRCDAHALGEDKVGTLFGLDVEVDGREVEVTLPRPQEVADALLDFVGAACGLSG